MAQINSNKKLKSFFKNRLQHIRLTERASRVPSEYAHEIGSTEMEDIPYSIQLEIKKEIIQNIFSGIENESLLKDIEVEPSPQIEEYRFKMDFVCSFDPFHEPFSRFGQRKKKSFNWVIDMHSCILIPDKWFKATRELYEYILTFGIRNYDLIKHDGTLRYLTIKVYGDIAMISITLHNEISPELKENIGKFALGNNFTSVYFLLNDSARDDSAGEIIGQYGDKTVTVPLQVNERKFYFNVGPLTFFQNNIPAFEKILFYVYQLIQKYKLKDKNLYDLYCGTGIFSIIFASEFTKSIGIDIDKLNIFAANQNALENGIKNVTYIQQDLNKDISDIKDLQLENAVAIVDPPRTGLQTQGVEHVLKLSPEYLIYISCNPITQAQDLELLKASYELLEMKAFDLFPHTVHVENVVLLKRKKV